MKIFISLVKKDIMEYVRSSRIWVLILVFAVFGISNAVFAKLTPLIYDMLAEELSELGMAVGEMSVDALTSWAQFIKNVSLVLIVFVILNAGLLTKEYGTGTIISVLTRGVKRYNIILSKLVVLVLSFSLCYWLCVGLTYASNAFFWDNSAVAGWFSATFNWYLFGLLCVCLVILFSAVAKNMGGVMLGVGASVGVLYVIGFLPKIKKFVPTYLWDGAALTNTAKYSFAPSIIVTLVLCIACVCLSILLFRKRTQFN